jgi:2-iminobutanoate/2-iminopropanoate deaminase
MAAGRGTIAVISGLIGVVIGAAGMAARQGADADADTNQPAPVAAATAAPARQVIRPEVAPNTGLPYSSGILAGDTLYIAGHLGRDPVTSQLVTGGIEAETRRSLDNIGEVLKTAGMGFDNVTTVTVFITDFKEFEAFNKVYREYFPADPPARATVQVAALNAGARVELQMIAVRR